MDRLPSCEAVRDEIRKELRPGEPLLVVGPYGSGKTWISREAMGEGIIYLNADQLHAADFSYELQAKPGAPVLLDGLHDVRPEILSRVRHFLASTSRNVVCLALSRESLDPSLLPLFRKTVEVGK